MIHRAALAIGLCILGMPAGTFAQSDAAQAAACPGPGLSRYASRSYATETGVRRRCSLLRDIERGGALASPALRQQVLKELSHRYAVEIDFTGVVGLPRQVVDYLLEYMPETAFLVSTYSGKEYAATQVDGAEGPERFFVTDNDSFAAGFTYLLSHTPSDASEYIFFESGRAKVLLWSVWGNSFVRYDLRREGDKASRYDIKIQVFTESRLLRAVLGSGLFRYFARSMFDDVLSDIESAMHEFAADSSPGELLPPYFVTALKKRLQPAVPGFQIGDRRSPLEGPRSSHSAR